MNRPWLFLLAAAGALLAFLGTRGLNEPDEGRYAEIGREMAVSGDWLVPHLNGFPHFQKPPVIYWATAASISILGANEWAARLPSAAAAFGVVALTLWMGTLLFGTTAGMASAIVLLSSLGFFVMSRLLTPDMTLTFWITAAIACFVRYVSGPPQRRWIWLFFAATGMGFLTKGPMAFIVPLSAGVAGQISTRSTPDRPRIPWVRGLALSFAIGLSWFVALAVMRHDLFDYFWRYELVERFASSKHGRSRPFWFFLPILPGAFIPWVYLLPALIMLAWKKYRQHALVPAHWFLLGWVIVPFLILSLSGSKLPTYILPLLPPLALASGVHLTRKGVLPRWVSALALGFTVLWIALSAFAPLFNKYLEQQASIRTLVRPLQTDVSLQDAKIYAFDVRAHGLEFYLGRTVGATRENSDLVLPTTPADERRLLTTEDFESSSILPAPGEPPVVVLTREDRVTKTFLPETWQEIGRAGEFILLRSRIKATMTAP